MKNIQKLFFLVLIAGIGLLAGCTQGKKETEEETPPPPPEEVKLNGLTEKEVQQKWVLLFDGNTMDNWRGYPFRGIELLLFE